MSIVDALIMGLVQGLTEFLPVSSSGHLVIAKHLLGGVKDTGILFEVLLHFGTLLAVLFYFRQDILSLLRAFLPSSDVSDEARRDSRKLAYMVIAGTIPTVVIALLFKDLFESLFTSVRVVSIMLLVTGLLLFLSDKMKITSGKKIGAKDAIIIGTVQGLAIIPGISRSGSTIATGLFRGIKGEDAATFSFLLAIPAILGAVVLHVKDISVMESVDVLPYFVGVATAAISGFLSIKLLMKVVAGRNLKFFAFYCWIVGLSCLTLNL